MNQKTLDMKQLLLVCALSLFAGGAYAQDDPVIMTVAGQPVLRSEFEYSYNKNNSEGVIDKKSVNDYVDLFINYKLKVKAAEDAHLDTLASYQKEFASYRDKQIRPSMINDADVEQEAYRLYSEAKHRIDSMGGMVKPAHIFLLVKQKASAEEDEAVHQRIDSIYNVLQHGGNFAELARKYSDDKGSAANGGELPWLVKGQTLKEFEQTAYSLKKGEMSKPFRTAVGYHIMLLKDKAGYFPYDSVRANIIRYIDQRGVRESIIDHKLDSLAKVEGSTPDKVLAQKREAMEEKDPNLKYLIREYHDGLLLYEVSNREVWAKAANDEPGLKDFFRKNRKQYKWDAPRFKGVAYSAHKAEDVEAVKKALRDVPFEKWADVLRTTFNNDSVLRIHAEKGIFKEGDNALVDKEVFGKDTVVRAEKDYPYSAIYGKKLKKPEDYDDVRAQVVADYQDALEKQWVAGLRKKYAVTVDRAVLATVNKH